MFQISTVETLPQYSDNSDFLNTYRDTRPEASPDISFSTSETVARL